VFESGYYEDYRLLGCEVV